jgi:hypothetical protein
MKDDLTFIEFKVTDKYYGYPNPFIQTGSIVLLVQDGEVKISRYHEPTDEEPFPSFSHPSPNIPRNKEIEDELYKYLSTKYPQYLSSEEDVVFLCPIKYISEIIW